MINWMKEWKDVYVKKLINPKQMHKWINKKCFILVRIPNAPSKL